MSSYKSSGVDNFIIKLKSLCREAHLHFTDEVLIDTKFLNIRTSIGNETYLNDLVRDINERVKLETGYDRFNDKPKWERQFNKWFNHFILTSDNNNINILSEYLYFITSKKQDHTITKWDILENR